MTKRELSKWDFEALDHCFAEYLKTNRATNFRIEELKDLFAKAHTGWLEIEED